MTSHERQRGRSHISSSLAYSVPRNVQCQRGPCPFLFFFNLLYNTTPPKHSHLTQWQFAHKSAIRGETKWGHISTSLDVTSRVSSWNHRKAPSVTCLTGSCSWLLAGDLSGGSVATPRCHSVSPQLSGRVPVVPRGPGRNWIAAFYNLAFESSSL